MGHQITHIRRGKSVALHDLDRHVGHLRNGGLEHGVSVPHDRMPVVLHGLDRSRIARTARLHVELQLARTVRTENLVQNAVSLFIGFQQYGGGAVTEDRAGGTVGVVHDRRHLVGADDHDLLARTRLDEFRTRRKGEKEAAARRRNVVCKGVLASRLIGDQVARRGEKHIGGHRSADHQIDLHRVHPRFVQKVDDRAGAHVGGTYALTLEDMARLDADMRHDPFVGRIDHGAQLFIRKDVIRQILTYTRYRCCYFTH